MMYGFQVKITKIEQVVALDVSYGFGHHSNMLPVHVSVVDNYDDQKRVVYETRVRYDPGTIKDYNSRVTGLKEGDCDYGLYLKDVNRDLHDIFSSFDRIIITRNSQRHMDKLRLNDDYYTLHDLKYCFLQKSSMKPVSLRKLAILYYGGTVINQYHNTSDNAFLILQLFLEYCCSQTRCCTRNGFN